MSEKRFYVKKVTRDERPKLFSSVGADYKYFIVERVKRSWGEYGGNFLFNFDVNYAFAEKVCNLLNEQQATIEELRLQEREKGVSVFVVREGKNQIALFFNEQRARLYCQENMANLTYQQEKWCRVE